MGRKRNWTGKTQGQLTVLREAGRDAHGNVLWLCRCECGTEVVKSNNGLNRGVKSCGVSCGVVNSNATRAKHGMWKSKEYQCWAAMKQRCLNPNTSHYKNYGGRGITIHPAWIHSFEAFYADVGPAPDVPRASLDRIDVDGDYIPTNVRWATPKVQSNNRRVTLSTEFRGTVTPLADIARMCGLPYTLIFDRFKRGLRGDALVTRQKLGRKPKDITHARS